MNLLLSAPNTHSYMRKISKKLIKAHNYASASKNPSTTHEKGETYLQHTKGRSLGIPHHKTYSPRPLGNLGEA